MPIWQFTQRLYGAEDGFVEQCVAERLVALAGEAGVASNAAVCAIMVGLSGHSLVQPGGGLFRQGSVASKALPVGPDSPMRWQSASLPRRAPWRVAPTLGAVLLVAATGESRGSVRPGTIRPGHPAWLTSVHERAGASTVR